MHGTTTQVFFHHKGFGLLLPTTVEIAEGLAQTGYRDLHQRGIRRMCVEIAGQPPIYRGYSGKLVARRNLAASQRRLPPPPIARPRGRTTRGTPGKGGGAGGGGGGDDDGDGPEPLLIAPSVLPPATPFLPSGHFKCIVADPCWQYRDSRSRGAAALHYATMSVEQIRALNVRAIAAQNSHLFLWTTNSFLVEAHEIARAWGFEPKTIITWLKLGPIGLGRYFRGVTEHIVFGVRGRRPLLSKSLPNFIEARKRGHSVKPDEAYALIERASPGPRLEMFARAPRAGWTTWGLEADGAIHQNQALINPKVGGHR